MKAWQLSQFGSLDNLTLVTDVPEPTPGRREVVLEVEYAALNPADRYLAEGAYPARPAFPHVLGRDGIGRVVSAGEGAGCVRIGDVKVIVRGETGVSRWGTFAERVAVDVDSLVGVPEGWTREQAAGATLVYLTAFQAITQWPELPEDAVTLVTGATGGVGVATCQLARAMGHAVVALSRSAEKSARLRELGVVDLTLDPNEPAWPKELAKRLGRKVDLAVDNVGGPGFNDLINVMGSDGRVSVVGRLAGPVPQFNTASLLARRLRIGGVFVSAYSRREALQAWGKAVSLINQINQKPIVDRIFPFDELHAAFDHLARGPMGKVLVRVKKGG